MKLVRYALGADNFANCFRTKVLASQSGRSNFVSFANYHEINTFNT